ncbi:MAG: polyphosphate kinase 1, partial [Rectinema sp.]|nr:polyphosphate kinase 1 [Rectinema sp.]
MKQMPMLNRELSWLDYNARVLAEGLKPSTPLLEQLRFISIFASNLDEFFMVRVAAVKAAIAKGLSSEEWAGMGPEELRTTIHEKVQSHYQLLYRHLHEHLLPDLATQGIHLVPHSHWKSKDIRFLEKYFAEQVYPLLTPLRLEGGVFPATGSLQVHVA